jgi:Tol biopolymer transport system component
MRSIAALAVSLAATGLWSFAPWRGVTAEAGGLIQGEIPGTLEGMLVFVRAVDGSNELVARRFAGGGVIRLGVAGTRPHVAPDGRRLAYTTPSGGIGVLDLDSHRAEVIANPRSDSPRWSPDGRRILFWSDRGGSQELWTMLADGSGAVRLSDGGGGYHEADWSPDGTRIVLRRVTGDGGDLWTMKADGTGAALLHAGERMDSDPRWSPDGRRIAFVGTVRRSGSGFTSAIFVIDADGANPTRLTHDDHEAWSPSWSPDGARIAFFSFAAGPDDPDILTIRPDGTDARVLVGGETYDHGPTFGPLHRTSADHTEEVS